MNLVHESIHRINKTDVLTLEHRLSTVMRPDPNAPSGCCRVFCLYFERDKDFSCYDSAGAYKRDEYRIVYYNNNPNRLILSKKSEMNGMSGIENCEVSREFVQIILNNRFDPLLQEFYWEVVGRGLRPRVLVDYDSKIYVNSKGNTQITINYNPRSSANLNTFLDPYHATVPIRDDKVIVHVKWNSFLPDVIRSAVTMSGSFSGNYSYNV